MSQYNTEQAYVAGLAAAVDKATMELGSKYNLHPRICKALVHSFADNIISSGLTVGSPVSTSAYVSNFSTTWRTVLEVHLQIDTNKAKEILVWVKDLVMPVAEFAAQEVLANMEARGRIRPGDLDAEIQELAAECNDPTCPVHGVNAKSNLANTPEFGRRVGHGLQELERQLREVAAQGGMVSDVHVFSLDGKPINPKELPESLKNLLASIQKPLNPKDIN